MSQYIKELVPPSVVDSALDEGYRNMAADQSREADAFVWCEGLSKTCRQTVWFESQVASFSKVDSLAIEEALK